MQFAESLLLLYSAVSIFYFIFSKKSDKRWGIAGIAILLLHFILGEARWQNGPVYLVLSIILLVHFVPFKASKWLKVPAFFFGIVFTLLSAILCYALPVFTLPKPTGPYAIASKTLYLKDSSRMEDITADPNDLRELMIDVWYPASATAGDPKPYFEPTERKGFAAKYGLPAGSFRYLSSVETHVYEEATPEEGAFPVLIFSPGYYTPTSGYHSVLSEIASHGFVIFSINHSYETMGSRFPDGREIFFDQGYADRYSWSEAMGEAVKQFENSTENEKYEAVKVVNTVNQGALLNVNRWSADISAVIDAMEGWNRNPEFILAGQLKLDQIGAFGHSRGGASALEASLDDPRIKVSANLDGAQWGSVINSKLDKPTAVFSSASSLLYEVNHYIYHEAKGPNFYDVVVAGTGHSSFSDIPYMVGLTQLNEAGPIDPKVATAAFNGFLLGFFQKYLSGEAVDLNAIVSADENLTFKE